MDEFIGRMATQRHVLKLVNETVPAKEKLFGLSSAAIDRWAVANQVGPDSELVLLLQKVSSELFFMATRSQEPVSGEYELRQERILEIVKELEESVRERPP